MKRRYRVWIVICLALVLGALGGLRFAALGTEQLPWELPGGGVNPDNLPDNLVTLDCVGNEVGSRDNPLAPGLDQQYIPPTPLGAVCDPGVGYQIPYTDPLTPIN
jgi:hypothetical protein